MDRMLGYEETSELLGIAKATLYSLVCRKMIPHRRLSGRMVRFSPAELEVWLDARAVGDCRLEAGVEAGK